MQRMLLAVALFCVTTRAHAESGSRGSPKRVALLLDTTDRANYVVVSCKVGEAACGQQCAEVWCSSGYIGDCPMRSRQVIQVADPCATCKRGVLILPRADFEQLSDMVPNRQWISVRWRYVDCERKSGSSVGSSTMQVSDEAMRPALDSRAYSTSTFENAINEPIRDGILQDFASGKDETAAILNAVVETLRLDNDNGSKSGGASDSDSILALPRGSRSATSSRGSSSSSSNSDALSPTLPPTLTFPSTFSTIDQVSSSGDSSSASASSGAVKGDINFSVGTVAPAMDSVLGSTSTGFLRATDQPLTPTMGPSAQVPSSSDDTSMATSTVTKSPLFYAAIVLGIVGLIGVVVGHRAKQKRSDRNEWRAFQISAGTVTPSSASRPALLSRTTHNSHNIAML